MSTRTEDLLHQASAARAPQPRPAPVRQAVAHPGAVLSRAALAPADVLALQRTLGNRAVQRMLATRQIQAKLTVNTAGDVYEQEADAVARQVVSSLGQPQQQAAVQRQPEEEQDEIMTKPLIQRLDVPKDEEDKLMTMPSLQREGDDAAGPVDAGVESAIEGARGGGQPMDHGLRGKMEESFGADFSGVRIHTGAQADSLNKAVQARAFTTGQDIFFGGGEYNPGSSAGKELLAHELTHVVQQNGPAVNRKDRDAG